MNKPKNSDKNPARDEFQTPDYAVDLLIPFIPKWIPIWECAAGGGKIVRHLRNNDFSVIASTLGKNKEGYDNVDFLAQEPYWENDGFIIITNPPFSKKQKFYERCLFYGLFYKTPFALLIPADYSGWVIEAVRRDGAEKIIPTRRIDYITPMGRRGKTSGAQFHSMWLTRGFDLGKTETYVELALGAKKNV